VGRDIGDERERRVARVSSGMGQCDKFNQNVIVGDIDRFRLEESNGLLVPYLGSIQTAQEPRCIEQHIKPRRPENWTIREQDRRRFAYYPPNEDHRYSARLDASGTALVTLPVLLRPEDPSPM
jgi:hypothetical protein